MIQRYRPKNKYYIEGWLMTHQQDKQVTKQDGRLSYLGITSETLGIFRNLTESLDYYFERVDWNKYQLKNDFNDKQSTTIAEYTIHDDLMELMPDSKTVDEPDIPQQEIPDTLPINEWYKLRLRGSGALITLLDDLYTIARTYTTLLLKEEDE